MSIRIHVQVYIYVYNFHRYCIYIHVHYFRYNLYVYLTTDTWCSRPIPKRHIHLEPSYKFYMYLIIVYTFSDAQIFCETFFSIFNKVDIIWQTQQKTTLSCELRAAIIVLSLFIFIFYEMKSNVWKSTRHPKYLIL